MPEVSCSVHTIFHMNFSHYFQLQVLEFGTKQGVGVVLLEHEMMHRSQERTSCSLKTGWNASV